MSVHWPIFTASSCLVLSTNQVVECINIIFMVTRQKTFHTNDASNDLGPIIISAIAIDL